ncbi:MAG: serine/threonine-protein phosphatase [Planctomycetes bacterium]|nr:serine/threonine-protein phosphatase [Planctomycetota bacterium]
MAGRSDMGRKRKNNEDSYFFSEGDGLCIVADGMGGLDAGEVASSMAIQSLSRQIIYSSPTEILQGGETDVNLTLGRFTHLFADWLRKTNEEIHSRVAKDPLGRKMGTTVALLYMKDDYAILAGVGDTRIYRLRGEKLSQVSHDHSWVGELSRLKDVKIEPAILARYKNVLTRALGVAEAVEPDIQVVKLEVGDTYLLCTDGLTNMVNDMEIESIIVNAEGDLKQAVDYLIHMANHRGGIDNITVVLNKVAADT